MQNPLVSILILNWNGRENLKRCLESIYKNTNYRPFEIIVNDNNSSDGSLEMLLSRFPKVKVIRNDHEVGIPEATNQCFAEAKGKYFFLLGNDTIVTENWLSPCVEIAESSPNIASVGSWEISPENLGKVLPEQFTEEKDTVCSFAMLMSRKAWEKVGNYDKKSFSPYGGDETDWNYRARNQGFRVLHTKRSIVAHCGAADSSRQNSRQYFLLNKHRLRAMLYNDSLFTFPKRIPGLGLIFLRSFRQGQTSTLLRSYAANIADWKNIVRQRKLRRGSVAKGKPLFF